MPPNGIRAGRGTSLSCAVRRSGRTSTGGPRTPEHLRKTPPQRAAISVLLAASPLLDGVGGRYFEDCNEPPALIEPPKMFGKGVAARTVDADNAAHPWDVATGLLKR